MADKSKIPTVILEPDLLNEGNTIPKGSIIITDNLKKRSKTWRTAGKTNKRH